MNKKILMFSLIGLFAVALVTAGYYTMFSETFVVTNPIQVTGDGVEDLAVSPPDVVLGDAIKISNNGDEDREVVITSEVIEGDEANVEISYIGKLELTTKNTATWEATSDRNVEVIYTIVGEEFETEVELESGEVLVYAMDKDDRFVNYASVIKVEDINGDLPYSSDWNKDGTPNYCDYHNGFDDYEHCNGAKLWIVKESDLGTAVEGVYPLSWANMNTYVYETDLIYYFDNADNELVIPANSFIEFYPQYDFDEWADGDYTIKTTIA